MFRDNAHGRVFESQSANNTNLTVESCIAACKSNGFTLAGLEYAAQCCGSSHETSSVTRAGSFLWQFVGIASSVGPSSRRTRSVIWDVAEMPRSHLSFVFLVPCGSLNRCPYPREACGGQSMYTATGTSLLWQYQYCLVYAFFSVSQMGPK